ncbi:GerMN domain-containing protein [Lapillicoccus sp.]|uniref:GerMN domain-containing protein n=1 Tax=Lapillicoccus sp. TaxID=1909287 RepID=UPI0032644253
MTGNRRRGLGLVAGLLAGAALLTACGIPTDGQPSTVPTGDVPYGLLDGTPTSSPTPSTTPGVPVATSTIYLVDSQQLLVAVPVQQTQSSLNPLLQTLLNRLALGPGDRERSRKLATDLSPGSAIVLRSMSSGTATIEIQSTSQDPSAAKLPIAIGQVVLTATSVVGVDRVLFVQNGAPARVPGPTGPQTSDALAASDYTSLLAPGQAPVDRTVPLYTASPATTTQLP